MPSSQRGRPPSHTVRDVVAAAAAIVDEAGVQGVSMHAVADRAGFSRMGLYRYVDSKEQLLRLVPSYLLESVAASALSQHSSLEALADVARGLREVLDRHPNAAPLLARPDLGPDMIAAARHVTGLLVADGADPDDAFEMVRAVVALTIGEHLTSYGGQGTLGVDLLLDGISRRLSRHDGGGPMKAC